jgi:hypothetical protein
MSKHRGIAKPADDVRYALFDNYIGVDIKSEPRVRIGSEFKQSNSAHAAPSRERRITKTLELGKRRVRKNRRMRKEL